MLINSNGQNSNRIGSEWSLCMVKAGFVTLFYINNIFDRSFAKILGRICVFARVWIDNGAYMALVLWIPLELWTLVDTCVDRLPYSSHMAFVYFMLFISFFFSDENLEFLKIFYLFMLIFMRSIRSCMSSEFVMFFKCFFFLSRINNVAYFAVVAFPSCSFLPFSS